MSRTGTVLHAHVHVWLEECLHSIVCLHFMLHAPQSLQRDACLKAGVGNLDRTPVGAQLLCPIFELAEGT